MRACYDLQIELDAVVLIQLVYHIILRPSHIRLFWHYRSVGGHLERWVYHLYEIE